MIKGSKIGDTLLIAGIILIAFVIDFIRRRYHIPIALWDIIFFPLSVLIIFYSLKYLLFKRKKEGLKYLGDDSTLKKSGMIVATLVLLLPLGMGLIWMGVTEPLGYFSGKGGAHGYTLIPLGLLIAGFSVIYIYITLRSILLKQ